MPTYIYDIGRDPTKDISRHKLSFNWRNTIPWDLECEQLGYSRELGLRNSDIKLKIPEKAGAFFSFFTSIAFTTIVVCEFVTFLGGGCLNFCSGGELWYLAALGAFCTRSFILLLCSLALVYLNDINTISEDNLALLNEYETVECSDKYSNVHIEPAIMS